jgi:hypothetical protein
VRGNPRCSEAIGLPSSDDQTHFRGSVILLGQRNHGQYVRAFENASTERGGYIRCSHPERFRGRRVILKSISPAFQVPVSTPVICLSVFPRRIGSVIQIIAVAPSAADLPPRSEIEKMSEQLEYAPLLCILGMTDAALGRKDDAIREGRRAVELIPISKDSISGAQLMLFLAVIYAWCGENDLALEEIRASVRIASDLSYGNLRLHPYWDLLRGDPRFEKIVAALAPKDSK